MTGWAGSGANRTWQRDRRTADSGRIDLVEDVRRILAAWRATHNWVPGSVWNPYKGTYELPEDNV